MYNGTDAAAAAGGAGLAYTGSNSIWYALAAFALISAGAALMRIRPKKQEQV